MPIELANEHVIMDVDGNPNFAKFLKENFDSIALWRGWNAETQEQFKVVYNRYVLNNVNLKKALADFDNDDYRDYCKRVFDFASDLAEETIDRNIRLFRFVYEFGVHEGLYEDNLFFKEREMLDGTNAVENKSKALKVVKSLSIESRLKIVKWILGLDAKICNDLDTGFIIMFLTGARVNEVCGLTYGNVLLKNNPKNNLKYIPTNNAEKDLEKSKFPVIAIVRSTKIGSSEHKISGKTSNADRFIPVCWALYNFIEKRKEKYKELGFSGEELNDTPIVADNQGNGVSAQQLSKHIRKLFDKLGIYSKSQRMSLVLDLDLQRRTLSEESYIAERDITAYVLRRNYSTMYAALGMTEAELQYIFGHEVESDWRESYVNEDKLEQIYKKIIMNPVCMLLDNVSIEDNKNIRNLNLNGEKNLRVEALEPCEPISFSVSDSLKNCYKMHIHYGTKFTTCSDNVDILEDLLVLYRKEWEKLEQEDLVGK